MTFASTFSSPRRDGLAPLRDLVALIRSNWRNRAEFNRVFNELTRLTDRDLSDIGIGRSEIPTIAAQAASNIR